MYYHLWVHSLCLPLVTLDAKDVKVTEIKKEKEWHICSSRPLHIFYSDGRTVKLLKIFFSVDYISFNLSSVLISNVSRM